MDYPRTITLNHPKLVKLQQEKGQLIDEGRVISEKIEGIELEMGKVDIRLQAEEAKVDISDYKAEGDELIKKMEDVARGYADQIKVIEQKIYDRMAEKTDPKLREQYKTLEKEKLELETERNKKALKAQQKKDRIIPLARRVLMPYLQNEYEDFNDIRLEGDKIIATIFSHLDDWDKRFKEKRAKIKS